MKKWMLLLLICLGAFLPSGRETSIQASPLKPVLYFWGDGCPACKEAAPVVDNLLTKGLPVEKYEVYNNRQNAERLTMIFKMNGIPESEWAIPVAFYNGNMYMGVPRIFELEKELAKP